MALVVIESADLEAMIQKVVERTIETHGVRVPADLPAILDRSDLKKLLKVGDNKITELLKRPDFPVTREFGDPRIMTSLFFRWTEEHSGWMNKNVGEKWNARRQVI
ncbi:hypothetical protein [Paenibacillus sp. NPDC058177]|uniref:hypothetical protein n=1 Tax=Paenibacillus sp. NPDC058177 TaxID=3346369 RepID=UPI0036DA8AB1